MNKISIFIAVVVTNLITLSLVLSGQNKAPFKIMKSDTSTCQLVDVRTVYSGADTTKQYYVTQKCLSDISTNSKEFADNILISNS